MSAVLSAQSQRRGLCKWFYCVSAWLGHRQRGMQAFMRLAQSKLVPEVISCVGDIDSQQEEGGEGAQG